MLSDKLQLNTNRTNRNSRLINIPIFTNNYLHNQPLWSAVRNFNDTRNEYEISTNRKHDIKLIKEKPL